MSKELKQSCYVNFGNIYILKEAFAKMILTKIGRLFLAAAKVVVRTENIYALSLSLSECISMC